MLGLTASGTALRLDSALKRWGLPVNDPAPVEGYLSGVLLDKKRAGSNIDLVLLREIGDAFVHPVPVNALPSFLGTAGERSL